MSDHEISFNNTKLSEQVRTRADFTYKITADLISITDTGLGFRSVTEDIEAVLRKIEHWHQGAVTTFKIMCRDATGFWHRVHWGWQNRRPFLLYRKPTSDRPAKSCTRKSKARPITPRPDSLPSTRQYCLHDHERRRSDSRG